MLKFALRGLPPVAGQILCFDHQNLFYQELENSNPTQTFSFSGVGSIDWHPFYSTIFGANGHQLTICDTRNPTNPINTIPQPGASDPNSTYSFSWNPFNRYLFAESTTNEIFIRDIRQFSTPLHTLSTPSKAPVMTLRWSPNDEFILASTESDQLLIWNLADIGKPQTPIEKEDGPPELLFIHGGHTSKINDFSWNQNDPWTIASVAEDNILQVWKMAEYIYNGDSDPKA